MNHVNDAWEKRISEAIQRARAGGRGDVAEYIALKSSNDAIRATCVAWLIETVLEIVTVFKERGASITIDQKEDHTFFHEKANLTGSFLKLQRGVRCLTIEAGWTRNPGDGFMRGGALAFARIKHFGFPKECEDLILYSFEGIPQWFSIALGERRISFDIDRLRRHFEVFLED